MELKQYKKAFALIIYSFLLFIALIILNPDTEYYMSPYLPTDDYFVEMIVFYTIYLPLISIGAIFLGYLLTPLLLALFRYTLGKKMFMGIQENIKPKRFRHHLRGTFPALMALNFAMMFCINEDLVYLFSNSPGLEYEISYINGYFVAFIILLLITTAISMAIFTPIWNLIDAGIIFSNEKSIEKKGKDKPIEARSLGRQLIFVLKGYAGISVIFTFITFFTMTYTELKYIPQVFFFLILIVTLPYFLIIANLPAIILMDIMREHRIKFTIKIANKMGIKENIRISIEKLNGNNEKIKKGEIKNYEK